MLNVYALPATSSYVVVPLLTFFSMSERVTDTEPAVTAEADTTFVSPSNGVVALPNPVTALKDATFALVVADVAAP